MDKDLKVNKDQTVKKENGYSYPMDLGEVSVMDPMGMEDMDPTDLLMEKVDIIMEVIMDMVTECGDGDSASLEIWE